MKNAALNEKPDVGNQNVRFDEGEVASARPRRRSLRCKSFLIIAAVTYLIAACEAFALEWSGKVSFPANQTVSESIVLVGDTEIEVLANVSVTLSGPISGAGNIKKSGAGVLTISNAGNTFVGSTTVTAGDLYVPALANKGTPSPLGAGTTDETSAFVLKGGAFYLEPPSAGLSFTTDRPYQNDAWLRSKSQKYPNVTFSGPINGTKFYVRDLGSVTVATALPSTLTDIQVTGTTILNFIGGESECLANVKVLAGGFNTGTLADDACAWGLGSGNIVFGQTGYSGVGKLIYSGLGDAVYSRGLTIARYSGATYSNKSLSGAQFCNNSVGTRLTLAGDIVFSGAVGIPNLALTGDGDGVLKSDVGGLLAVEKFGAGTWTLSGEWTSTGGIEIKEGCLNLDGVVSGDLADGWPTSYKIDVAEGATLGGTGVLSCAVRLNPAAVVAPGLDETLGTLTFDASSSLSVAADVKLVCRLGSDAACDKLVVQGPLTAGGTVEVALSPFGAATPSGEYVLMTWPSGSPAPTLLLTGDAPGDGEMRVIGNELRYFVPNPDPSNVSVWVGDGVANAWDHHSANWSGPVAFKDGDDVKFTDSGSDSPAVDIVEMVRPGNVIVAIDKKGYAFAGDGALDSSGMFMKSGIGAFTNRADTAFLWGTHVLAGDYVLEGSLVGPLTVKGGAKFTETPGGVLDGSDMQVRLGYGTHSLSGANTFTGSVLFDSTGEVENKEAVLSLGHSHALGNASEIIVRGHADSNVAGCYVSLENGCVVSNVTFRFGANPNVVGRVSFGSRQYNAVCGWNGDIICDADAKGVSSLFSVITCGRASSHLSIGDPEDAGSRVVDYTGYGNQLVMRGLGDISVYSRILNQHQPLCHTDAGTMTLYATNNDFSALVVANGTVAMAAVGAIPAGVNLLLGEKTATTQSPEFATFDLHGYDQTVISIEAKGSVPDYMGRPCRIKTDMPATLTVDARNANSAFGNEFQFLEGSLSLVKRGSKTLTLGGNNAMTGTVSIVEGALAIVSPTAFHKNSVIRFPEGADGRHGVLDIANGVTLTVDQLFDGVTCRSSGLYGSLANTRPDVTRIAAITGGGVLKVRHPCGAILIFR